MISNNQEIANCFRAALKLLWNGKARQQGRDERYICHALYEVGKAGGPPAPVLEATGIIRTRLGGSYTVESWLQKQGVNTYDNIVAVQAWRKQWLEQLIEEFDNK